MAALHSRCRHYIFVLFLSSFFLGFFPRLISVVADWMSTILAHMAWPSVNLECRSEMYCTRLAENTGHKKSPSRHHRTTLSGCIFPTKACIDNRKNVILSRLDYCNAVLHGAPASNTQKLQRVQNTAARRSAERQAIAISATPSAATMAAGSTTD